MAPTKKFPCIICGVEVGGKKGAVQCSFCDEWVHPTCGHVSPALLKMLIENPTVKWTCDPCHAVGAKIKAEVTVFQNQQKKDRLEILGMQADILKNSQRLDLVEDKIDKLDINKKVVSGNESVYQELRDREVRKDNLVFHNIVELPAERSSFDKSQHDTKQVLDIFKFLDYTTSRHSIKFLYRAGERRETNRPRPIILALKDSGARQYVLANTRMLANSEFSKISIIPDLTKQQRKEEDGLRKDMDKKNNELSEE